MLKFTMDVHTCHPRIYSNIIETYTHYYLDAQEILSIISRPHVSRHLLKKG